MMDEGLLADRTNVRFDRGEQRHTRHVLRVPLSNKSESQVSVLCEDTLQL